MAALSRPKINSFFACGDFNQRLTTWGTRSIDDMNWVLPGVELREITVSYRQSRQLNELARAIIMAVEGEEKSVSLPDDVDNDGVAPTLLEGEPEVTHWLAKRIREIESFVGDLPSVAIFVGNESEVQPLSDSLGVALAEENTRVIPCHEGQVMGQDNDVRYSMYSTSRDLNLKRYFLSV